MHNSITNHQTFYNLTPTAMELVDFIDDGEDARHFRFRLITPQSINTPKPGQFFMLSVPGAGEAPFTFTAKPDNQGVFRALIRKMGDVTTALFQCQSGAILGIRGPFGKGWPIASLSDKKIIMVAGGCGLAPLTGLIDQLIAERHHKHLALVYGARNRALQMLNPERLRWQREISLFDVLEDTGETVTSSKNHVLEGTPLDAMDSVLRTLDWTPDMLLLCGPEVMMKAVAKNFLQRGLPAQSIWLSIERRMHCAVGLCGHCYLSEHHLAHHYVCKDGPTYRWDYLQPPEKTE